MIRGKDIKDSGLSGGALSVKASAGVPEADVTDKTKLGRIKMGWFDGM